eukprot:8098958-Alexandrium_andersonii.AAC.1
MERHAAGRYDTYTAHRPTGVSFSWPEPCLPTSSARERLMHARAACPHGVLLHKQVVWRPLACQLPRLGNARDV